MIGYVGNLAKLGFPLGDELATDLILQSLLESFNQFVLNFTMLDMEKTLPQLLNMLRQAEQNMRSKGKSNQVLMIGNGNHKGNKGKGGKGKGKEVVKPKPNPKALKPTGGIAKEGKCFHYNKTGHWKRNCPKYLEDKKNGIESSNSASIFVIEINLSTSSIWPKPVSTTASTQQEWKPKGKNVKTSDGTQLEKKITALVAHTSLRASSREDWYFDSGCSRHMTGIGKFLVDLKSYSTSFVTCGNGTKGEIVGIGELNSNSLPKLSNVLLVKGLTANLISISQLCDQGMKVNFTKSECLVTNDEGEILMRGVRSKDNCYLWVPQEEANVSTCLITKEDEIKLWHQKLGHLNLRSMKKAIPEEAIKGLPNLKIEEGNICGECQIGKQTKKPHPKLQHLTTTRVLELLHMDLMEPMQTESLGGKRYAYVVVNDFSRYTWINFIGKKSETFDVFKDLCILLQREKNNVVLRIRSDHGKEFENSRFSDFCASEGIIREFSSLITPQQNGVVERKNRIIQESARVMLHAKKLSHGFLAEAMNTACHIHNRVTLRSGTTSTLYELWKGRKPTVKYFHVFGSKCYILSDREPRTKMVPKRDEGIFFGYSTNSRAYRVYNYRTKTMMESINVVIDDISSEVVNDDTEDATASIPGSIDSETIEEFKNDTEITTPEPIFATSKKGSSIRTQKNHPTDLIIGNPNHGITTRRTLDLVPNACFVSKFERKNVMEALTDEFWINAMQEELNQFKKNEVWDLVPRPENTNVIGTKIFISNLSQDLLQLYIQARASGQNEPCSASFIEVG
ncbi:unnamed protein product [Trifolium pratense]|uniref:Uncharacterized protein n=1 Tax=Trifolium pratense TaxID=57577 RepID=A0ACB0ILY2_TRIPR|nr:unnamed protein product [Trifolium pratense]